MGSFPVPLYWTGGYSQQLHSRRKWKGGNTAETFHINNNAECNFTLYKRKSLRFSSKTVCHVEQTVLSNNISSYHYHIVVKIKVMSIGKVFAIVPLLFLVLSSFLLQTRRGCSHHFIKLNQTLAFYKGALHILKYQLNHRECASKRGWISLAVGHFLLIR